MTDPLANFRTGSQNAGNTGASQQANGDSRVQAGIDYVNANGGDPKQAALKLLAQYHLPIPKNPLALAESLIGGKR